MTNAAQTPNPTALRHHFLVTGEVVFGFTDRDDVHGIRLNAMISHEEGNLPVFMVGRMQQALQFQFHKRMQDPKVAVRDVVILNISPLGRMTKEEFERVPEGLKEQPMVMTAELNQEGTLNA